jgi:GT2 family glycosyltransferase
VDLCWRARLAGWEARVVPAVTVVHVQNATTDRIFTVDEFRYLTFRNRLRTVLANAPPARMLSMVPLFLALSLAAAVGQALVGRWRSALAIASAISWPLRHPGEVRAHRRFARSHRRREDREVLRPELEVSLLSPLLWRHSRALPTRRPRQRPSITSSSGSTRLSEGCACWPT